MSGLANISQSLITLPIVPREKVEEFFDALPELPPEEVEEFFDALPELPPNDTLTVTQCDLKDRSAKQALAKTLQIWGKNANAQQESADPNEVQGRRAAASRILFSHLTHNTLKII